MQIDGLMAETSWLRRLAENLVRDPDLAADVVQETVIIAAEAAPRDRPLRPWLHRVLLNRVRMHARGAARRSAREVASSSPPPPLATPEELVARVETQRLLAGVVLELPEAYRVVVLLHYVEGLTSPQIAARLGIADATVRWRLRHALGELRTRLDRKHANQRAAWLAPVASLAESGRAAPPPSAAAAARAAAGAFAVKQLIAAVVVVVALLAGVAGLRRWRASGDERASSAHLARVPAAAPAAEIVAAKRAARRGAPLDARPAAASGHVTRASDGTGVAGAVVALHPAERNLLAGRAGADDIVVLADETGAWRVPAVPVGAYTISAAAPGLLPTSLAVTSFAAGAARAGLDLALAAGGLAVSGTVSDIAGGPIAGAQVRARAISAQAFGNSTGGTFAAITGADGRYQLTLGDGDWTVEATDPGYAPERVDLTVAAAPRTASFELTPGGAVHGRVLARDTRVPVAGAVVRLERGGSFRGHPGVGAPGDDGVAITAADGTFTLRGLRPGAVELAVTGPGVASSGPLGLELGLGEQATGVELLVDRGYTLSGFVVDARDRREGLAGVSVAAAAFSTLEGVVSMRATGADGYFEIHGLRPGVYNLMAVGHDTLPGFEQSIVVADRDIDDILIGVSRGLTLSGRVVPGVQARLSMSASFSGLDASGVIGLLSVAMVQATSDATGAFELRNVPPGRKLTLLARTRDGRSGELELEAGRENRSGLVIALEERGSIAGRVVDAAGEPVANVRVAPRKIRGSPEAVLTEADGAFRLHGLAEGTYQLSVFDADGAMAWASEPAAIRLDPREHREGVTLTVEARDAELRGLVLGPDGKPARDVWVSARIAGGAPSLGARGLPSAQLLLDDDDDLDDDMLRGLDQGRTALTGEDGRFTLRRLRRGTYEVIAEASKGAAAARHPGAATGDPLTLTLEPLGSLAGIVRSPTGPITDYTIECESPTKEAHRRVLAADGAYQLDRLPAGTYRCTVTSDAGPAAGTVTITSAPARLDLTIGTWGELTGTIVDSHGAPVAGLRLVTTADGATSSTITTVLGGGPTTDDAGRFRLDRMPAGGGMLIAFGNGIAMTVMVSVPFRLEPGQRLDLGTLRAEPATALPPHPHRVP